MTQPKRGPVAPTASNVAPLAANTLLLSDEELKVLSELVRQSNITASSEELLMLKMGKSSSVLLDLVYKIAVQWEQRAAELNAPALPPVPAVDPQ